MSSQQLGQLRDRSLKDLRQDNAVGWPAAVSVATRDRHEPLAARGAGGRSRSAATVRIALGRFAGGISRLDSIGDLTSLPCASMEPRRSLNARSAAQWSDYDRDKRRRDAAGSAYKMLSAK